MDMNFTTPGPTLKYVLCSDADGGHRMAYWQWGDEASPHVIVCVHGLSRQGRDFDVLARALCQRSSGALRVVCPDVVGRGQSDWLKDPMGYQLPLYAADMLSLLATLEARTLDWVGTSMGGLIGMAVCAMQATHEVASVGAAAAPGRPKQGTAPSGGSAAHEVASVGAAAAPGRPKQGTAPSGAAQHTKWQAWGPQYVGWF